LNRGSFEAAAVDSYAAWAAQSAPLRADESTYLTCETQLLGVIAYLVRFASAVSRMVPRDELEPRNMNRL